MSNTRKDFGSPIIARTRAVIEPFGVVGLQCSLRILQTDTVALPKGREGIKTATLISVILSLI